MPYSNRLMPGKPFPAITLPTTGGSEINLNASGWRAVFVIRGAHCSICREYLNQIEKRRSGWEDKGIEVVVVSADPPEKSQIFTQEAGYQGIVACSLDVPAMQALNLWMTGPDVSTLDYVHPEPGFFFIDPEGNIATVDISNLPAIRPDLDWMDKGFTYMTKNGIRPTFGSYEV
ncbi:MAG: redoxin domain-containing protein [Cyanobacteria bacterium J06621_15]